MTLGAFPPRASQPATKPITRLLSLCCVILLLGYQAYLLGCQAYAVLSYCGYQAYYWLPSLCCVISLLDCVMYLLDCLGRGRPVGNGLPMSGLALKVGLWRHVTKPS